MQKAMQPGLTVSLHALLPDWYPNETGRLHEVGVIDNPCAVGYPHSGSTPNPICTACRQHPNMHGTQKAGF